MSVLILCLRFEVTFNDVCHGVYKQDELYVIYFYMLLTLLSLCRLTVDPMFIFTLTPKYNANNRLKKSKK